MAPFLFEVLQASLSPVVLISGIGLLLLSMSNRYAKLTDRSRELVKEIQLQHDAREISFEREQIRILYLRAGVLRKAMIAASVSVLGVALTILAIFFYKLTASMLLSYLILACFCTSMIMLCVSMGIFIRDVTLSLKALKLEVSSYLEVKE